MTDAATRPAADRSTRRAPTPAAVGAGLAVGLITAVLLRIRTTPDVDLWLHLRIGDLLNAGQGFGAGPDPLAALADRPYVPTQWLAQRAMAWTWAAAGMTGIQVVRLLLVLCLGAVVVAVCRLVAPATATGFAAAVTMFGAAAAWGERPQLLGLVLFAGVTLLWWRSTLRGAVPWAVVPLTWLWACVHGSWLLGVAAGGVLLAGAVADRRLSRRRTVQGALVLVASVVAAALTPLGTAGPHRAVHRDRHGVGLGERVGSSGSGQPGLRGRPPGGDSCQGWGSSGPRRTGGLACSASWGVSRWPYGWFGPWRSARS